MRVEMLFQTTHYRDYLKEILKARTARNPRYSLRAMSAQMGITPSMLSEVLNGRKNLSPNRAAAITRKLRLNPKEAEYFLLLVRFETADADLRQQLVPQIRACAPIMDRLELDADAFRLISEWYHVPILELCALPRFILNESNVCAELGITPLEALHAIERLKRHGLIVSDALGRWSKSKTFLRYTAENRSDALRAFHRQMLERTLCELDRPSPEERYMGTETFPMPLGALPAARARIDECFDALLRLSAPSAPDAVLFHAGIQLTPIRAKTLRTIDEN